jgi:LDH2 family malate/lactate/ureidoglycolate dehydrogenase
VTDEVRFHLDDVRRIAARLLTGLGVAPARAAAMVGHLLWFDGAGAPRFGIASLPRWLERIRAGEFDLAAEGSVLTERNGTALLDCRDGLPLLLVERGTGLAVEKAREAGVGLVRLMHVGPPGPAAGLAAEMAIGPFIASIVGPGASWTWALPSRQGLPVVLDSALADTAEIPPPTTSPPRPVPGAWGPIPWSILLAAGPEAGETHADGWLIVALSVTAWEPLTAFHDRVDTALAAEPSRPGLIRPDAWDARRRDIRERGVPIASAVRRELAGWAELLGVPPLGPIYP